MTIDKDEIKFIAKLAKLKFDDEDVQMLAVELEKVLSHFDNIDKEDFLDIEDVLDISRIESKMRGDEVVYYQDKKEMFRNTKQIKDGYIMIPKVLD